MQEKVAAFVRAYRLSLEPSVRYMDFVSEAGELGKEMLKASGYGQNAVHGTDAMALELGDSLFSLLALAESLGMDAQASLDKALAKYAARLEQKGTIGSE